MKSSLSLFLVLSSLCVFANSQATYPDCVSAACTPLRDVGLSCGYDFADVTIATSVQTKCICGRQEAPEAIQKCLGCTQLSAAGLEDSNLLIAVCHTDEGSSVPPSSTTTPASSSTASTSSATPTSDTTNIEPSNTNNSTSTINSSSEVSTNLPQATSTSSAAASHMTPVVGFAALLLVAHVGL